MKEFVEDRRPWYSKYGSFILIYSFLWFFSLSLLGNLIYSIIKQGYTNSTYYFALSLFFIYMMLLFIPFRYKTFEKRKRFGLAQSKYVAVSENSSLNSTKEGYNNLRDYEVKLENFFTIISEQDQVLFNSKNIHKSNGITILAWLSVFIPTLFFFILAILIVSFPDSLLTLVVIFILFYRLNRFLPNRQTFYQIIFSDTRLLIALKLKNGKSQKIKSINISNIDYVSYQIYQSKYRITFGNSNKIVPFLEKYSQEEVELIYPILGQFIKGLKNHTIAL